MNNENSGLNQESTQSSNRALLLEMIRKEGVCSRALLSQQSSLKQSTITYIINDFIKWGLVVETGLIQGSKGRRSIGIAIDERKYSVLGVRITRNGFSVGAFNLAGSCITEKKVKPTSRPGTQETLNGIVSELKTIMEELPGRLFLAMGVSVPGPFNAKEEKIVLMTETTGWDDINIRLELQKHFDMPIFLVHDANAGAWAQLWYNKELNWNGTIVYISAGQGIGSGILVNGETMTGAIGYAGEIGHMSIVYNGLECECGNYGCLEKYTSSIALTRMVNEHRKGELPLSFEEIKDRIWSGDELCREIYEKCCDYLAAGVINIVNCLNPEAIIIGDDMAEIQPELMSARILKMLNARTLPGACGNLKLIISRIEHDAELYGAAIIAIREIYKHTNEYFGAAESK